MATAKMVIKKPFFTSVQMEVHRVKRQCFCLLLHSKENEILTKKMRLRRNRKYLLAVMHPVPMLTDLQTGDKPAVRSSHSQLCRSQKNIFW